MHTHMYGGEREIEKERKKEKGLFQRIGSHDYGGWKVQNHQASQQAGDSCSPLGNQETNHSLALSSVA